MDVDKLTAAGFVQNADMKIAQEEFAAKNGMHTGGPYVVQGVWRRDRDLTTLLFEQNTAAEPASGDGRVVSISHPAVCVVSGPHGKITCSADQVDLVLKMADLLGSNHCV